MNDLSATTEGKRRSTAFVLAGGGSRERLSFDQDDLDLLLAAAPAAE